MFQVYKYDDAAELPGGPVSDRPRRRGRRLLEGSEAIAEAMVAAGCRFFAGYPMTPFTEVLEHMARLLPGVGGVCMNAESELEAVGMAWGAAATGTPAATGSTGQGLSLMQESLAEITLARLPLVVLNMARAQGDYFQATRGGGHGDYRHLVLAPMDVGRGGRARSGWPSTWPTVAQPGAGLRRLLPGPHGPVGRPFRGPVDPAPCRRGRSTARRGGTGRAKLISPLGQRQAARRRRLRPGRPLRRRARPHTDDMAAGIEPLAEVDRSPTTPRSSWWPSARRPATSRPPCASCGPRACAVGFVRPITLYPVPDRGGRPGAADGARAVAVYEINQGQMIDDVRLAVLGRAPVEFIGGLSLDSSGFGIAPDLDVRIAATDRGSPRRGERRERTEVVPTDRPPSAAGPPGRRLHARP